MNSCGIARLHHAEADEQAAEQQNFGRQEQPHTDLAGIELLLHRGEMMLMMRVIPCHAAVRIVQIDWWLYSCGYCVLPLPAGNRTALVVSTGCSSKLCSIGGEDVCHSSVVPPHGLSGASIGLRSDASK